MKSLCDIMNPRSERCALQISLNICEKKPKTNNKTDSFYLFTTLHLKCIIGSSKKFEKKKFVGNWVRFRTWTQLGRPMI